MSETARASRSLSPNRKPANPVAPPVGGGALQRLKASAGNSTVAPSVAQRLGGPSGHDSLPVPAPPPGISPRYPRFVGALNDLAAKARVVTSHSAPEAEVAATPRRTKSAMEQEHALAGGLRGWGSAPRTTDSQLDACYAAQKNSSSD